MCFDEDEVLYPRLKINKCGIFPIKEKLMKQKKLKNQKVFLNSKPLWGHKTSTIDFLKYLLIHLRHSKIF